MCVALALLCSIYLQAQPVCAVLGAAGRYFRHPLWTPLCIPLHSEWRDGNYGLVVQRRGIRCDAGHQMQYLRAAFHASSAYAVCKDEQLFTKTLTGTLFPSTFQVQANGVLQKEPLIFVPFAVPRLPLFFVAFDFFV